MVDNAGFISTLGTSPSTRLVDGTDNIHSGIINALNIATGGNRAISGFNITQSDGGSHTTYTMTAGTYLRNDRLLSLAQGAVTPSTGVSSNCDHYSVIVINSSGAFAVRDGAKGVADSTSLISVSSLAAGDIPIAVVKITTGSANDATNRPVQFLGYAQEERELSVFDSNSETLRINKDGTLTKGGSGTITLPASGTLATTDGANLASDAIDTANIQNNAITSVKISSGAISTTTLADTAVTTAKITDANVTEAKLANDAVTADKLASNAVVTASVVDDAITYEKMQNLATADRVLGSTSTGLIGEVQIVNDMIADNTIAVGKINGLSDLGSGVVVSSAERTKLSGIEASADVTDINNVKLALSNSLGTLTLGDSNDTVVISGNLTIAGTTTTINTGTINLADNILTLNSDATGSASADAGLEVERGDDTNVLLKWNETTNRWTFTNDGSTFYNLPISSEITPFSHPTSVVSNLDTSGAEILDTLETNSTGHITAMTKRTLTKGDLGLGNVENTAISSFTGTSNIATVGTIGTGTWQGTAIATAYIANSAITTAKINDDAVTAAKIADGVVVNAAIADNAAIAQSKINGLSTSLNAKQDTISVSDGLNKTGSTIKVDIDSLDEETGIDRDADYFMFDDATPSTDELHKVNLTTIFSKLVAGDVPDHSASKITSGTLPTARIADNAVTVAKISGLTNLGSGTVISSDERSKLSGIASGAEVNVKSNWNETSSSADSFIENKPTIPSGNQIIDWTSDQGSTNIHAGNYINTEYSVGDGGLTQVNFTTTRSNKLDGIANNANNFSLTTGAVTNDHLAGSIAQSKITGLTTALGNTITELGDLSITASASEINKLDGVLVGATQINHLANITSNIQTQLNSKLDSTNVLGYTLSAATTNSGTDAVLKLTGANGGGVTTVAIEGGNSINTSVGAQGQLVLSALSAVEGIAFTEGLLTLTYANDGGTTTATIPDATTSAHGLMTDTQFDQLAANVSKLSGIEASADVTDTANVTSAGALMDSELTDLAGVKGVTISTLQVKPSEGAFANGDKTKLDSIESSATADQTAAEIRTLVESASDSNVFTDADHSKLNAIEASATADQTASEITALLNDVASYSLGTADSGTITVNHDLTVSGDLIISGATTTVNSNTVNIGDSIITLNSDETGTPSQDAGIEIERGSSTNKSLYWDESEDEWTIGAERFKAGSFEGDGSLLTALNGSQVTSGTIAAARVATLNQDTTGNAATATKIASITNSNIVQLAETQSLTNKTINASNNTLSNIGNSSLSNSAITIDGSSVSLGGSISTTNTQLTTEQVQDIVGDMFASNTETRISASYVDGGVGAGKINLVVDDMTANDNTFRTITAGGNTLDSTETLAFTAGTGITIAETNGAVTITNSVTDTNTQNVFASSFVDSSDDIILRLTKSGASSGTQDIKFVAGSNVTLTHTDANNITIASTDTNTNTQLSQAQVRDFAGGMFTGNTETFITATYQTGDDTVDLVVPVLDEDDLSSDSASHLATQQSIKAYVDAQTTATTVTVSDSTANTNFPVVFHNESNGLLDDTGALRYNPSTGTLLVPNLSVAGTTTQVNTVTMEAANAIVFEGATPDTEETTLTITDPTADRTITLPNASGTVAVSASAGVALSAAGDITANLSASHIPNLATSKITSGTFADARIAESNVTQHLAVGTGLDLSGKTFSVDVSDFMANGANNRILTATGADAMTGESTFTYDGAGIAIITGALPQLQLVDSDATNSPMGRIMNNNGNLSIRADSDDTGTGGAINFRTSDSEKMRIQDDGKVGIGTASPATVLHVESADNDIVRFKSTDDLATFTLQDNDTTAYFNASGGSAGHLSIGGNAGTHADNLNINVDTGNAGIGTNAPVSKLQVVQDDAQFTIIAGADVNAQSLTDNTRKFMRFGMPHYDTDEQSFSLITGDSNDGVNQLYLGGGTGVGNAASNIFFNTAANATTTTGTTRMAITDDGKIGIGDTNPLALLHIEFAGGDTTTYANTNETYRNMVLLRNNTVTTNAFAGIAFDVSTESDFDSLGASIAAVRDTSASSTAGNHDANLVFATNDAGDDGNTERMRITHDGNVGIGDTSPSEKLHVAGNILVNNNGTIKANGSGYLVLGNTSEGVIKVHGDSGASIIEGFGNNLVLQTVRDADDIIFNVNKGGTDSDATVVTVMKVDGELGHVDIPTDDTKLRFGAGQDLSIYHDGSNSYIDEEGTGSLIINSSQVAIKGGADAAENMATFVDNGAVTLYHNNAAKFATTATGVSVTGTLAATSKSFVIPHPTKEKKTLRHGSLEGPEHGVYVRGTLESKDSTEGFIELPDYWLGLVDEDTITVQLTGKGRFQRLYVAKIEDNKVYVENEKMHDINCYYFVQAERKDIRKMVVEY